MTSGAGIVRLLRGIVFHDAYHGLQADLGRAILLEPEFLMIADIIGTVAAMPTQYNLGVLAGIVVLEFEVSKQLPPRQKGER